MKYFSSLSFNSIRCIRIPYGFMPRYFFLTRFSMDKRDSIEVFRNAGKLGKRPRSLSANMRGMEPREYHKG